MRRRARRRTPALARSKTARNPRDRDARRTSGPGARTTRSGWPDRGRAAPRPRRPRAARARAAPRALVRPRARRRASSACSCWLGSGPSDCASAISRSPASACSSSAARDCAASSACCVCCSAARADAKPAWACSAGPRPPRAAATWASASPAMRSSSLCCSGVGLAAGLGLEPFEGFDQRLGAARAPLPRRAAALRPTSPARRDGARSPRAGLERVGVRRRLLEGFFRALQALAGLRQLGSRAPGCARPDSPRARACLLERGVRELERARACVQLDVGVRCSRACRSCADCVSVATTSFQRASLLPARRSTLRAASSSRASLVSACVQATERVVRVAQLLFVQRRDLLEQRLARLGPRASGRCDRAAGRSGLRSRRCALARLDAAQRDLVARSISRICWYAFSPRSASLSSVS